MSLAILAAPFDDNTYNNPTNSNNTNNNNNNSNDNHPRKRLNKTQKRYNGFDSDKVNSVLNSIHQEYSGYSDSDLSNDMGNYEPMKPPSSVGVENTKYREQNKNQKDNSNQFNSYNSNKYDGNDNDIDNNNYPIQYQPQKQSQVKSQSKESFQSNTIDDDEENVDISSFQKKNQNFYQATEMDEYYKKIIPNYNELQKKRQPNVLNKSYYLQNATSPYYQTDNDSSTDINNNLLFEKLNYMIHLLEENQDEKTGHVIEEVVLYSFLGIFIIFIIDSFVKVGRYVR
jgi:hypothetical protein